MLLPFQVIEQVDEPRVETPRDVAKIAEVVGIFGNDTMKIVEVGI